MMVFVQRERAVVVGVFTSPQYDTSGVMLPLELMPNDHPDVVEFVHPHVIPDLAPYQFRAMLKLSGKQDALYSFIEALSEPQKTIAQAKLEYSLIFKRDNDLVAAAKQALGLTDAELDTLWQAASQIV